MEIKAKETGRLGENLVKRNLEENGFYVTKGYSSTPDLKIYRAKPPKNRVTMNYITCEVKTTRKNDYPERPKKRQRDKNDLFARVILDEVHYGTIKCRIKYDILAEKTDGFLGKFELKNMYEKYRYDRGRM